MTDGQSKTGYPLSYKEVTHSEERDTTPRKPNNLKTGSRDKSKGSGGKSNVSKDQEDLSGKTKLESTRVVRKGF